MSQSTNLIEWLTHQDVATVQAWLQSAWTNPDLVGDLDWKHLAMGLEVLALSGREPTRGKPDLAWARVTIAVLEYLVNQTDPISKIDLQNRIMDIKAMCILHHSALPSDPLLDVNQIVSWFFEYLPLSLQTVETLLASPHTLTTTEAVLLNSIKTRMYLLHRLVVREKLAPNEELKRWLALREQLP